MPEGIGYSGGLLSGPAATTPENVVSDGPLDRIFTGLYDPRLSPEENDRIRRSALINAGLAGLVASSRPGSGGLLETIGLAGAAGQATRAEQTEALLPEVPDFETQVVTRADGSTALINKTDGRTIRELGPPKAPEPEEFDAPKEVLTPTGQKVLATWSKRNRMYTTLDGVPLPGAQPLPDDPERGTLVKELDPETGLVYQYFADPTSGRQIGPRRLADTVSGDEVDTALANQLRRDTDEMRRILSARGDKPFGVLEQMAGGSDWTRGLTSPEFQQFFAASNNIMSLIVRSRSGAQASEMEVKRLETFAVPRPGESPETVRSKIRRLESVVQDIEQGRDPFDRVRGGGAGESGNQMEHLVPGRR